MNRGIKTYYRILLLGVFFLVAQMSYAQKYTETDLKVAYLYNFTKFITWPSSAFKMDKTHFTITVIGNSSITRILHIALKGKKINGKDIVIKQITDISEIKNTQILFITQEKSADINLIIEQCNKHPILLVGDYIEYFCESQGIINFTDKHDKYRFEINNEAAKKIGLRISSKLLSLSRIINGNEIQF